MPPRYVYWTIIAGGLPTAFRAADRDELLPTFHRLREKQPDAELKYFADGRLWESPDEVRLARANKEREARGRDWRPGGDHKDPRDRFKVPRDVKRARFKAQAWRDRTSPKPKRQGREGGPPKRKKEDEE